MKECWRDGDLRAFLDRELSPADTERVTAHLAECHECEARYDEIAGRAGLVSGLLESLAELEPVAPLRRVQPVRQWRRWAGAGAAIAAGIAIAALLLSKQAETPIVQAPSPSRSVAEAPATQSPAVTPALSASAMQPVPAPARPRLGVKPRRQLPRDVFLALDDEPIETGIVVRMTLGEDEIPADVVFGKDGRARAIRLIGTQTIH
jgi:anti-sigma factor RsiW